MRFFNIGALVGASLLAAAAAQAASTTLTVAGSADPYLAGQPAGTNCCAGDAAPGQTPALVTGFTAGNSLSFSATGAVGYSGGITGNGADGDNNGTSYTFRFTMPADYGTGIAGAQNVNVDALVGVFVSDDQPASPAPSPLDFGGSGGSTGLDFASLSPGLNQIFFIGDGLTGIGSGSIQQFLIPTGATRLYLGTVDGGGWFNNGGSFRVTVNGLDDATSAVPEPASWAMMIAGFGLLGAVARRSRQASRPLPAAC